jgi:hypothetical protein
MSSSKLNYPAAAINPAEHLFLWFSKLFFAVARCFSLASAGFILDSLFFSITMRSISVPAKPLDKFKLVASKEDITEFSVIGCPLLALMARSLGAVKHCNIEPWDPILSEALLFGLFPHEQNLHAKPPLQVSPRPIY